MTVAEELREWALCSEHPDVSELTYPAWGALSDWWIAAFSFRPDDWRTFALLVAEALETQDD